MRVSRRRQASLPPRDQRRTGPHGASAAASSAPSWTPAQVPFAARTRSRGRLRSTKSPLVLGATHQVDLVAAVGRSRPGRPQPAAPCRRWRAHAPSGRPPGEVEPPAGSKAIVTAMVPRSPLSTSTGPPSAAPATRRGRGAWQLGEQRLPSGSGLVQATQLRRPSSTLGLQAAVREAQCLQLPATSPHVAPEGHGPSCQPVAAGLHDRVGRLVVLVVGAADRPGQQEPATLPRTSSTRWPGQPNQSATTATSTSLSRPAAAGTSSGRGTAHRPGAVSWSPPRVRTPSARPPTSRSSPRRRGRWPVPPRRHRATRCAGTATAPAGAAPARPSARATVRGPRAARR